jgi:predicted ATPase
MGLHTGTPLLTKEGYVGADVHRAARIASAAHGGQILVSAATAALVDVSVLRDLGEHRLKDLSAPERIHQLGDEEFPPLKTLCRTNLPIPATPFLGRQHELAEVRELLGRNEVRLLTLTGPGGSGKTRLALQAAAAAADHYPQGIWWVALAPLQAAGDVAAAAARMLGGTGPLEALVGDRRLLLLLDNFEHLIDAAPQVASLLRACPNVDLIVTSRERLRVAGEQLYPVPTLARAEAHALFVSCARAARPDFAPDELVDELCARLDDLPLALELAAARITLLSTAQLLDRLGQRLDLLRGGRDAEMRQRTLRATIEWSYELLDADERRLLCSFSIFRGGWTLEAAETVCDADIEGLESLVDKSLVRRWEFGRFGLLETIRGFAAERLEPHDHELLLRRLLDYLRDLFANANLKADSLEEPQMDLAQEERPNVDVAIGWALEHGHAQLGLELIVSLEMYWTTNDPAAGRAWIDALLNVDDGLEPRLHAETLRLRGSFHAMTGHPAEGVPDLRRAMDLFDAAGDEDGALNTLHRLAHALFHAGDVEEAVRLAHQALEHDRRLGRDREAPAALSVLAYAAAAGGDRLEAIRLGRESAALAEQTGFTWWHGVTLLTVTEWLLQEGDVHSAEETLGAGFESIVAVDDRVNLPAALGMAAAIAAHRRDPVRAGRLFGAVEAIAEREPRPTTATILAELEPQLAPVRGIDLEVARQTGHTLSSDDAIAYMRAAPKQV